MNRRKFIQFVTLGTATGVSVAATYAVLESFETTIAAVLKKNLSNLNISENSIRQYAHDAALHNPYRFSFSKIKMIQLYSRLERIGITGLPYFSKYLQYRSDIVGNFLLSTDFFWSKLKEDDKISYDGKIFSPYHYPCGNPFSNRYYS